MIALITEFLEFLKEYKVVALAIAFIIGAAATTLVKSLVDNIIMPFVGVLVPSGDWETATLALGPVILGIGPFVAECINFIVIALVVFLIAKKVMGEEKVEKK
jgi:large conductance mechanosensitive channel